MNELASITGLITAAGSVIGLASKTNTVEANQKILELQAKMAAVHQEFAELFQENQNLKEEKRKLQEEIGAESMYPFRESARWKKSADGAEDDGPFCPTCFATKKILVPLKFRNRMNTAGLLSFMCPEQHAPTPGLGRDIIYQIKETSIKAGRYHIPD